MKELNNLVIALQDVFANRLLSVFVFGSMANTSEESMNSNVDLFIVAEKLRPEDLTKLLPATQRWVKKGNPYPLVMDKEEFFAMSDMYAIEYSDIKWNHQLIYGDDLVKDLNVNYFDLRLQTEHELKNLIQKVRGFYLEHGRSKAAIVSAIDSIARTLVVVFRAILRLKNIAPSVFKQDLVEQLGSVMKINKLFFQKIIAQKEGSYNFSTSEVYDFNENLLNELSYILQKLTEI